MRRAAAIAAVAVAAAVVAIVLLTRGDDADAQERFVVGSGTRAAVVMRPHDAPRGRPASVISLSRRPTRPPADPTSR